jgi:hypothetical protein
MVNNKRFVLDLKAIYKSFGHDRAKCDEKSLTGYKKEALKRLSNRYFKEIVMTGSAPTWMYSSIQEVIREFCDRLIINTPATADVIIFDVKNRGIPPLTQK